MKGLLSTAYILEWSFTLIDFHNGILPLTFNLTSGRPARSGSERVPGLSPLPEASARGGIIVKGRFKSRGR
jgi:hypothetical protein